MICIFLLPTVILYNMGGVDLLYTVKCSHPVNFNCKENIKFFVVSFGDLKTILMENKLVSHYYWGWALKLNLCMVLKTNTYVKYCVGVRW